jgi:lipoate-protein ligase A
VAITTRAPAGVSPRELMGRYASGLLAGLAGLGVRAGFRGKNDLEVAGRKIAGLGLYLNEDGALLFHASVLAGLDVELMLDVLRIPGAKLPNPADRPIARVHQRITTVSEQLSRTVAGADIRDAIADGFAATLDVRLEQSRLGDAEHRRATQLVAHRYACPEWLGGRELDAGARGTAGLKTPAGFVRVYAGVQRDALSGVMFTGDFSVIPRSLVALEAALRWCRVDHARIAALTERELDPTELAVEPGAVADAVYEAAKRAMARGAGGGRSEPARTAGSCYYPEREAEVRAA